MRTLARAGTEPASEPAVHVIKACRLLPRKPFAYSAHAHCARVICGQLAADLNSGMAKPAHTFQIGQQVYHHRDSLPGGTQTGPYTIIGLLWQSGGAVRYCIKSTTREQIVDESDLELKSLDHAVRG
jgi:hypothetical protein